MKSMALMIPTVFLTVSVLTACGSDEVQTSHVASTESKVTSVAPGEFRLYTTKSPDVNTECDVFTHLKLVNGIATPVAILENKLEGTCKLAVRPDHRVYTLDVVDVGCGSKLLIETVGADQGAGIIRRIEIIDHRERVCKDAAQGQLIVQEFDGTHSVTRYGLEQKF